MILHQFNQASPNDHNGLSSVATGDGILLLDDSVYWLCQRQWQEKLPAQVTLYVVQSDAQRRGFAVPSGVTVIDYSEWVDLTLTYEKTVSW